jgi:hypothetical protein
VRLPPRTCVSSPPAATAPRSKPRSPHPSAPR